MPTAMITSLHDPADREPDYPTIRPHRLAVGFYDFADDGRLIRVDRVELDVAGERIERRGRSRQEAPALVLLNDDDYDYAKIRLDAAVARGGDGAPRGHRQPARPRAGLGRGVGCDAGWGNAGQRLRATCPRQHRHRDANRRPSGTTLAQLLHVARYYVAPARREATITLVGDELWKLAQEAVPGSDSQFQLVRFFANIASTPEHVDALHGLRDGSSIASRAWRSTRTSTGSCSRAWC